MRRRFGRSRRNAAPGERKAAAIDAARWFERLTAEGHVPAASLERCDVDGLPDHFAGVHGGEFGVQSGAAVWSVHILHSPFPLPDNSVPRRSRRAQMPYTIAAVSRVKRRLRLRFRTAKRNIVFISFLHQLADLVRCSHLSKIFGNSFS